MLSMITVMAFSDNGLLNTDNYFSMMQFFPSIRKWI